MPRDADARSFLPLTPLVSQVLLALAEGPRHGYGIILDVGERTGGLITLRTGTLYILLRRLVGHRLIEESAKFEVRTSKLAEAPEEREDQRRRYYRLTLLGQSVLAAEVRRLEGVLHEARRTRVLTGPSPRKQRS